MIFDKYSEIFNAILFSPGRAFSGNLGCQFFKKFPSAPTTGAPLVGSNQVYTNLVWVRFRTISDIYSTGGLRKGKPCGGAIVLKGGGGGNIKEGNFKKGYPPP